MWYFMPHLPLVPYICDSELGQHWFRYWLVACSAPTHYLNQCWRVVNWTLGNKLQWNSNRNCNIVIQENTFENVVCEMAAIMSRGRWVKGTCTDLIHNSMNCKKSDILSFCRFWIQVDIRYLKSCLYHSWLPNNKTVTTGPKFWCIVFHEFIEKIL